jgi:hypothetical protein
LLLLSVVIVFPKLKPVVSPRIFWIEMSTSGKASDPYVISGSAPRSGNASGRNSLNPDGSPKSWFDRRTKNIIGFSAMTIALVATVSLIVAQLISEKDEEKDASTLINRGTGY